jgi:parallel beta-helix repeat protein
MGTKTNGENGTDRRWTRVWLAALVLVVLVGVSMTGSAVGLQEVDSCDTLDTQDETYVLNQSITNSTTDTCLEVTQDNIVLDGDGFGVDGENKTTGSVGVFVDSASNVTVKNLDNVTRWETGIKYDRSSGGEITNNVVENNSQNGIFLDGPLEENDLTENTVSFNDLNGIVLGEGASNNTLRENTANSNEDAPGQGTGIAIGAGSNDNKLIDNTANFNGIYGIEVTAASTSNELIDNDANNNGLFVAPLDVEPNEEHLGEPTLSELGAGIFLEGVSDNTLVDNTANDNSQTGILLEQATSNNLTANTARFNGQYGIWLSQGSDDNRLIDNVAEDNGDTIGVVGTTAEHGDYVEGSSGIYIGGIGGPSPPIGNTLIDNTARGSEYGIWIKNSFDNEVSESLAEDNQEGIAVEIVQNNGFRSVTPAVTGQLAGNTFTDDTSRNNDWDFVADAPLAPREATGTLDTDIPVSSFPVTNLNIGSSTKPDTTLSFFSPKIRLKSVSGTESDPSGLTNIGRYFKAERTVIRSGSVEPEQELPPRLFAVAVSYEDADVSNVDESTLELRRYNETAGEWQGLENPALDQADNLVAGTTIDTSNFGVFAEPTKTCVDRRNLGRGQEDSECPFDRDVERGGSREGLDRDTGRSGRGEHRDSETARRNRGRGEGRSR